MSKKGGQQNGVNASSPKKARNRLGIPLNMSKWIDENKAYLTPPVCNKMMYGAGQLKIMFVGGPNVRKDYHIDEGEEFFYMVKGDMCLKIIERGKPKDVIIKEGEVFVLPSRIQHSPQRQENTIGLVIERERLPEEQDGLRYFCEDGATPLWERWFHCEDLGSQLAPIIKEYFASEEYKTGIPSADSVVEHPPVNVDVTTQVDEPFSLKKWIEDNKNDIASGSKELFGKGEFKIIIHGEGEQSDEWLGETWLMQIEGNASVTIFEETQELGENDVLLIPTGAKYSVKRSRGSVGMSVIMDVMANKP